MADQVTGEIYTDPDTPGAPQPTDPVVVVIELAAYQLPRGEP